MHALANAPAPCGRIAARSTPLFDVGLYRLDASFRGARHTHGRPGIALGVSGQLEVVGASRTDRVQSDTPLFIPADHPHWERVPFGTAVCVLAQPRERSFSGFPERGAGPLPATALGSAGTLLMRELTDADHASDLAVDAVLLEILAALARAPGSRGEGPRPGSWLARVEERLREEFVRPPSASQLAADAGVSASHLSRAFRAAHGVSIPQFVRRLRVRRAAHLLAQTDRPVADVALAAGFFDQSHLNRSFREALGVTPTAYRRVTAG